MSERQPHLKTGNDQPIILVVDDDDEYRSCIKENLESSFVIFEAANGQIGWQRALALNPHIIISDVDMPVMGGIELSKKLSSDNRTSHIPVLLLAGLASEQDYLNGLKAGAVDYITKPVNFRILAEKVKNWWLLREEYRHTYTNHIKLHVEAYEFESDREAMIRSIRNYVEDKLAQPDLSVTDLTKYLLISRGTLCTRTVEMTGMKPLEFIRSIKLERAAELLKKSDFSNAQIARMTGFQSPSYFSKIFKAKYNKFPSEYANRRKDKTVNANKS